MIVYQTINPENEVLKNITENITENVRGLEISKNNIQKCIAKGLTVIEGDAEKDLRQFPNSSYDFVILSQTLQAFLDPENVINELLRVGKKAIVSIPNFGHWRVRLNLLFKGQMPITENLPVELFDSPKVYDNLEQAFNLTVLDSWIPKAEIF